MRQFTAYCAALLAAASAVCTAADDLPVDFERQIKPILADRCVACHNTQSLFGELVLQSRELAMRERKAGPVIVPGKPDDSPLYVVLTLPPEKQKAMPATAHRLPKSDIAAVRQWILEGAHWPEGQAGVVPLPPNPKVN
jgi:mono/diheme cytochrome c family protein